MQAIIYTTPTCTWCKKLKEWLKKKKISYVEHDLSENDKAREEMIEKTGQMAVPVVELAGQVIVGFDELKLEEIWKGQKSSK